MRKLRSGIKEILEHVFSGSNHTGAVYNNEATTQLLQLFKDTVEKAIGEDEIMDDAYLSENSDYIKKIRNQFRKEQRQNLSKILSE
ncbi:MAG: hypothetical protein AABY22_35535 [Nanoarchaeota archaeon]